MSSPCHRAAPHLHGALRGSTFGGRAERFARFFDTPGFLTVQTVPIAGWTAVDVAAVTLTAETRLADRQEAPSADVGNRRELSDEQATPLEAIEHRLGDIHALMTARSGSE